MRLHFTKMQGLGNDFVVLDATREPIELSETQLRHLADRRFGVGCDQILLVEPPRDAQTDFYYRIFNADASEVEQCGNGARCFARYVRSHGLTEKDEIPVGTARGPITLYLESDGQVRVNMGPPQLEPRSLPFEAPEPALRYRLATPEGEIEIGAVSMGNPHAVVQVENISTAPVTSLGPLIEHHPRFPQRVNVGFMAVRNRAEIDLRVHERGAGETLACGTGACAAVVVGRLWGLLDQRVRVHLPGGDLVISWQGGDEPVWMTGPAVEVFEGDIEL